MTTTTVALAPVRRWILRTQSAHRERGATAGNIYFTVLFIAVVGGILHNQLADVFWPTAPNASGLAGASLVAILFGLLYLALRRFGPLALSRPAASWLMQAPVSRRRLLLPSLRLAVIVAAIVAVLEATAIIGHSAPRSLPGEVLALLGVGAGLAGMALLLIALAAQAGGRWGDAVDAVISLVLAAGFIGLVTATARDDAPATTGWPGTSVLGPVVGALALVVVVLLAFAIRRLARTPNDRILEASKTAGTLFDSAFGMEPSFLTDMVERRFWAHRKLRSTHLVSRLPALVAQDLILVLRRRRRLLWLALATTLPVLLSSAPNWLIGVVILIGLIPAGSTATGNVKTDAGNPVLLRMLGVTSRQVILQRLILPGVLGGVWAAVALSVLRGLGELPPGPWWALGLVLGPVGAAAAVHRARVGFVRNELLPLDTPMGTVSPGPLINLVIGPDMLLLGLPTLVDIAQGHPLSWLSVVTQAVVGVIGVRAYLSGSSSPDRVELKRA